MINLATGIVGVKEKMKDSTVSVGEIPPDIYEFYIATIGMDDVRRAIDFFERAKTDERYILYFRDALLALKFLEETLS